MNSKMLCQIVDSAAKRFSGDVGELEAAIGSLFIAHHFGYQFIYLVHNKRTVRKYEEILGLSFKHSFAALSDSFTRLPGLVYALRQPNYWKCVSGDVNVPYRRHITAGSDLMRMIARVGLLAGHVSKEPCPVDKKSRVLHDDH